jgi:hypothetical protein
MGALVPIGGDANLVNALLKIFKSKQAVKAAGLARLGLWHFVAR